MFGVMANIPTCTPGPITSSFSHCLVHTRAFVEVVRSNMVRSTISEIDIGHAIVTNARPGDTERLRRATFTNCHQVHWETLLGHTSNLSLLCAPTSVQSHGACLSLESTSELGTMSVQFKNNNQASCDEDQRCVVNLKFFKYVSFGHPHENVTVAVGKHGIRIRSAPENIRNEPEFYLLAAPHLDVCPPKILRSASS